MDDVGSTRCWVTHTAVLSHLQTTEKYLRFESTLGTNSRHIVCGVEKSVRKEWHRITSENEHVSLDQAIEECVVTMRGAWPNSTKLRENQMPTDKRNHGRKRVTGPRTSKVSRYENMSDASLKMYMCKNFLANRCNLGSRCPRAHTKAEQEEAIGSRSVPN